MIGTAKPRQQGRGSVKREKKREEYKYDIGPKAGIDR